VTDLSVPRLRPNGQWSTSVGWTSSLLRRDRCASTGTSSAEDLLRIVDVNLVDDQDRQATLERSPQTGAITYS
jgi:hypothetical protein